MPSTQAGIDFGLTGTSVLRFLSLPKASSKVSEHNGTSVLGTSGGAEPRSSMGLLMTRSHGALLAFLAAVTDWLGDRSAHQKGWGWQLPALQEVSQSHFVFFSL